MLTRNIHHLCYRKINLQMVFIFHKKNDCMYFRLARRYKEISIKKSNKTKTKLPFGPQNKPLKFMDEGFLCVSKCHKTLFTFVRSHFLSIFFQLL